MRPGAIYVGLLLALCPVLLHAQQDSVPAPGARIRVTAMSLGLVRSEGTLVALAGDTVLLRPLHCDTVCEIVRVPSSALDRLEVSRRSHKKGAMLGALVGSVAGAVILNSQSSHSTCPEGQDVGQCLGNALTGSIATALLVIGGSALVGSLIGGGIGIGREWRDTGGVTSLARVNLAPMPHGGVTLAVHASF